MSEIPLIPLSRATQQYLKYARALAVAEMKQSLELQNAPSLKRLRQLLEDVSIAKTMVQKIIDVLNSTLSHHLLSFTPSEFAQTLTGLDARLLARVRVSNPDIAQTFDGAAAMVEFHQYLETALISCILSGSDKTKDFQKIATARLEFLISTAFVLFYTYRNLASSSTICQVLGSPLIQSLKNAWKALPPASSKMRAHLADLIKDDPKAHHRLVADMLSFHQQQGQITVIPNLVIIVKELEEAFSSSTVHQSHNGSVILSERAQKCVYDHVHLVQACQGTSSMRYEKPFSDGASAGQIKIKQDVQLPPAPTDLSETIQGNLALEHWILTRIYQTDEKVWHDCLQLVEAQ